MFVLKHVKHVLPASSIEVISISEGFGCRCNTGTGHERPSGKCGVNSTKNREPWGKHRKICGTTVFFWGK